MKNRLCCNPVWRRPTTTSTARLLLLALLGILLWTPPAVAGDAPGWMHALVNAPVPAHDEKTDAAILYSERNVTVVATDRIKTQVRQAYKIFRPGGRDYGTVLVSFNSHEKITSLHGWCIPAEGKDYEVKDKEAIEISLPKIEGSELISDVRDKVLRIPAPDPGNIIGFEYEVEEQPFVLQETWYFQGSIPARERHFTLQLPAGWEYKATWLNYPEVKPTPAGNNQWRWVVSDVKLIREEDEMPPFAGVTGSMVVSFYPPGGASVSGFSGWQDMGNWYRNLTSGRFDASPEIKQKVATLTASATTPLAKMRALAQFVQHDIRYVAIELGIGGWQPHPAPDVFVHRYGDCKDKATLMGSMLHEIGVDFFYVVINSERGSVTPATPARVGAFNHMILAIRLPDGTSDPSLLAVMQHPRRGNLLFFDPTNELTPFGHIAGHLQANYGLLVTPDSGELVKLPQQPTTANGIQRIAHFTLDPAGTLKGDVTEIRVGDRAWSQRWEQRTAMRDADRIKPIERLLAGSLPVFQITKASVVNLQQTDQPFGFDYSFSAENYAKSAGGLLLVRPRVLGSKSSALLETKEPRQFPIEFDGPVRDTDSFEIAMPPGYEVEDLPPAVDADIGFAAYHSKSEVSGNLIRYTRTFEVKELSVPVNRADELRKFYRIIAGDERNTAVLRPAAAR